MEPPRLPLAHGAGLGCPATGASLAGSRGLVASAAAADAGTINVLTLGEGIFGDPFVKLSPEFTKLTGIKVNNVTMGYNETMQKQAAVFAAHGTDLDVVGVDYMFLKGYAKAGHLASLDKLIPKAQLDDYYSDTPANLKFVWSLDGETSAWRPSAIARTSSTTPGISRKSGCSRPTPGTICSPRRRRWSTPVRTAMASSPAPSGSPRR